MCGSKRCQKMSILLQNLFSKIFATGILTNHSIPVQGRHLTKSPSGWKIPGASGIKDKWQMLFCTRRVSATPLENF
ncbi:hypothetical protein FOPG_18375 [Fusarium oxysporum f. sp. conglutinans race 2 54008]|uniref:Uncharacterized protein n=1 Tax=Fusarium oxysporum f. sp. conglutinans race 2 54008 TaxID=1089457 RepID=X0GZV6_FUSOX|nr:hypothetical protein FOPG_18375 [Fusarium oxysporum f. sp. conglutinans race 2 54008]